MYHGIIQEAQWTPRGSDLRAKIEQYQLDKITDHGRVWRLRFDGIAAIPAIANTPAQPAVPAIPLDATRPRMLNETAAELVQHLDHPNGWWRDTAQRLLILKQDRSVVAALQRLAGTAKSLEGRFHALWTLEGLRALDASFVREQMKDGNPRMRVQAIRASETLHKAGDKSFAADYGAATKDADADVALQALLTLNILKVSDAASTIQATMSASKSPGVQEIGKLLLTPAPVYRDSRPHVLGGGTAGHRSRRGHLLAALFHLPCRGRTGHADGRRLGRVAARAVACRFATGPGSP